MIKARSKTATRRARNQLRIRVEQKSPFIEHVYELRKRLFFVTVALALGSAVAYNFHDPITKVLLAPAGDQPFIYTSPGGGFDFLFRLCLYSGILFSTPVIIYQLLRYLQPLMRHGALRFIRKGAAASVVLAVAGVMFGYFVGLPAAMHFLLQGFSSEQITALITIQSYLSFVMMYLLATAILFQIPLILVMINHIKPLKPGSLIRQQRWVVLVAVVASAIISPTPDIQNLLLLCIPMIAMFQLGVLLVWLTNRKHRKPKKISELLERDNLARAERQARFQAARARLPQHLQN